MGRFGKELLQIRKFRGQKQKTLLDKIYIQGLARNLETLV
ncbi:hypothetical protein CWATWH0005_4570 [Crocosphaera watsonii WH 0005]|uniref:Uncharacterized protein n=1 Tax=Crocosphaera watsonii WH 0005 TaxID=423472 RepID=T2J4N7_CROWT|nr:hypothetical protein CWATWH0005_4570 [Crocosphaera watsonii WH 0005]